MSEGAGPHGGGGRKLQQGGGDGSTAPGGPALLGHPAAAAGPAGVRPQGPGVHVRQRDTGTGLVGRAKGKSIDLNLNRL